MTKTPLWGITVTHCAICGHQAVQLLVYERYRRVDHSGLMRPCLFGNPRDDEPHAPAWERRAAA